MIPKIIHCCWFGGPKTKLAEECLASWRKYAPDWEIREWNESSLRERFGEPGVGRRLPVFVEGALAARKWAMVSDWLRMAVLHELGGVYFDFDVELVSTISDLTDCEWCSSEWTANGGTWLNPGGGIALAKGSPVAKHMLDAYAKLEFDPDRAMMPFINEELVKTGLTSFDKMKVFPPQVFSPIDCAGVMRRTSETRGIHHYAMGWAPWWRRALTWFSWHGGRPVVDALVRLKHLL